MIIDAVLVAHLEADEVTKVRESVRHLVRLWRGAQRAASIIVRVSRYGLKSAEIRHFRRSYLAANLSYLVINDVQTMT